MKPPAAPLLRLLPPGTREALIRAYAPGLGACAVALVLSLLALPFYVDDSIAALAFLMAVGLAGWYGGVTPALVAAAIGTLCVDYFFETPVGTLQITSSYTVLDMLSFVVVALLVGLLRARLHRTARTLMVVQHSRDELVDAVSHELRTPLTAIKTSVHSLRDRASNLAPERRDTLLSTIEVEADRLAHFVDEAMSLRRLEDGVKVRPELSDASEVASVVLDRYAGVLDGRQVRLNVDPDLPLIRVDPILLDLALSALLDNVAVHTPPGTPLSIDVGLIARDLQVTVNDAGPGVPEYARGWIFDKYRQVNDLAPGVGLGLAVARAAIDAHGGRLWVESSELGGARFVIVVPNAVATLVAA
jgi:two-component system sensor histidine kinase KdpD